ncbi:asparagine synthase [bacterium D16-54]|nr:asparagine synthase [bacterium D16-54]RKJ15199.1 asparagine synthase [bacterium D16-56]
MVDKKYCMSSYMAFRYIEDDEKDFFEGLHHQNIKPIPLDERILVHTAADIDQEFEKQFSNIRNKKLGVMLSGGMDSAIAASYMEGSDAYTFRFLEGKYKRDELERAEYYANYYRLKLHYVDIDWKSVERCVDAVMETKAAPVHSIEPQILQAALQAKSDGVELMVIGESSDLIFGGMDQLIGKDWTFDEFVKRYTFTDPTLVLKEPVDMQYLYERYRIGDNGINYLKFMDDVFSIESSSSYMNAFKVAGMPYFDPYAKLMMSEPLDLSRIRNGEPKYLIRELMKKKYPEIPVPNKIPMPRPVDSYFKDWEGPKRSEFKKNLNMYKFTGNQKWQIWCLERFLNHHS